MRARDPAPLAVLLHRITDRGACELLRHVSPGELTPEERETAYLAIYSVISSCLLSLVALETAS
jgi:hypothetical protein